ncbi:MAG: nucleoside triphosphate pyrophosphohydrolase [Lentisphaerales bacterium]|nr:nucleoside triphosphate pyrophosphohydrolase [Lentisphaerales bacterium]
MSKDKDWVQEIVDIMARLRAPDGCPWDQKQTHKSLKPYLIEESCEALDAIDDEDMELLEEELGDVLMNIVFHAQLATEKNQFTFQDVAKKISKKMIRRHPHVFDESCKLTPEEVEQQWDEIKKKEKSERESILEGIPRSLPALFRAQKLQKRAAKVGFDWPDTEGPLDKISEETEELKEAISKNSKEEIELEFGDLLFSMVNLARHLNIDADHALHLSNQKFIDRFQKLEKVCKSEEKELEKMTLEEMDDIWDQVKKLK